MIAAPRFFELQHGRQHDAAELARLFQQFAHDFFHHAARLRIRHRVHVQPVLIPERVDTSPEPTDEQLRILREIDPQGMVIGK